MNELRMYVEHLFEGKVLTSENIELKEEIYGNLVARYEDLIAGGATEDEALARTKESLKSLDELAEEDEPSHVDQPAEISASKADEGSQADNATHDGKPIAPVDLEASVGAQEESETSAKKSADTVKILKYGIIAFAVIVVLALVGKVALNYVVGAPEPDIDRSIVVSGGDGSARHNGTQAHGVNSNTEDNAITVDKSGNVWLNGEPGDELLASVVDASSIDVAPYVDTKLEDAAAVEALLHALPLGECATDVDVTKGSSVLSLAYRDVPEAYDDDSVDVALAYNVAALFSVMPLVNEIQVTVTEEGEALDEEYYVFTRNDVQGAYGVMLSSEMVNESGWRQLKNDHLYGRKFAERLVERAECEWR